MRSSRRWSISHTWRESCYMRRQKIKRGQTEASAASVSPPTDEPLATRPGSNQDAVLSAILWNDRWCFSRSSFVLSCRSSFCRARLRTPGSFSPSKILGGSGLTDAATASCNWIQVLHGICLYLCLKRTPDRAGFIQPTECLSCCARRQKPKRLQTEASAARSRGGWEPAPLPWQSISIKRS